MISTYATNFIGSDGIDLGSKLLTKERFNEYYLNISNQYITPELWVWGNNYTGELGINDGIERSTPVTTFSGAANWKQISSGNSSRAAIKTDGTLWVWGNNSNAQLGTNNFNRTSTPVTTFAGGNNWRQVSCGFDHAAAIKTDGTLWVWGEGSNGKLGRNSELDALTPVTTLAGGNDWKQVSTGIRHTAAIKTDGTLWTWGENAYGELGISGSGGVNILTPVTTFAGGNNWKQVSCGFQFTAAIKTDGSLWLWGDGNEGQLGNNTTTFQCLTPITTFSGGNDWKQVSCGFDFTFAIKTDGTLWGWGENGNGKLATNNAIKRSIPVTTFAGGNNWRSVDAANNASYAMAIKTDGTLWGWGNNFYLQIGTNNNISRSTPVTTFAGGNNWKSVSCGGDSTMAIRSYDD